MGAANEETVLIRGLSLTYRTGWPRRTSVHALIDVDLALHPGEILGVVGPNGSGKSSLFRCLVGIERPDRGELRVLAGKPGERRVCRDLGYVAEGRLPLGRLSARELLTLSGTLAGKSVGASRTRADEVLAGVGLEAVGSRAHADYSVGMERRLAFAQALYHRPRLLVLDEPTSGMDPLGIEMVRDQLRAHVHTGGAAIVATHGLEDFGEDGFDRIAVLLDGRKVADGPPGEVLGDPRVWELRFTGIEEQQLATVLQAVRGVGATLEFARPVRRSLGSLLAELLTKGPGKT